MTYIMIAVLGACVLVIADALRRLAKDVDRMCVEVERREVAELPFCPNRPQCAEMARRRCAAVLANGRLPL